MNIFGNLGFIEVQADGKKLLLWVFSFSKRCHVYLPVYGSSEWNPDSDRLQDVLQKCGKGEFFKVFYFQKHFRRK